MDIGTIRQINIEDEMRGAYLDYAMSVITSRALPDVRDGLKPVQRRILYAMDELGVRPGTAFKKSVRIVGEVLGKYHPHGDSSVYEAMVRMAQDFSLRYMLVDGQGNFGSVDGDPAAAMRYTEARLAPIAVEMLADIDKNTVDFTPNFDNTLKEPSALPTRLPNLLVNGASGIAVGMATNIPPHNLGEVVDALAFIIERFSAAVNAGAPFDVVWTRGLAGNVEPDLLTAALASAPSPLLDAIKTRAAAQSTPEQLRQALLDLVDEQTNVTPDELMRFVSGPDFPTGGIIIGVEGIKNAYTTGHGRMVVRAKVHTEEIRGGRAALIVSELPFQLNKANLVEKMADLVRERKIEGIADIRDESDREGMRLVIELKRDAQARRVLNALYKYTALQTAFSANLVALVDGQPRVLTLKMALLQYLSFRRGVVTRRTEYELGRARAREHVLEGLKIALDHLDEIIATIRGSRDAERAREALVVGFGLTDIQANAILEMQLRRLAALERERILAELDEIRAHVTRLLDLLANPVKILGIIRDELNELKAKYGDPRRTAISPKELVEFSDEDLIPQQEMVIVLSAKDYVKRMPSENYRVRGKGSRGVITGSTREDDAIQHLIITKTHSTVLFLSNQGRAYAIKAHEIPETSRTARGLPLVNLIKLGENETVTTIVAVPDFDSGYLALVTRGGEIKRLAASALATTRSSGLNVMEIPPGDELGWARLTNGEQEIMVVSTSGQEIRFKESDVRPSSRGSGGVRAMRLDPGASVAAADVIEPEAALVIISDRGIGKRVDLSEFPTQNRGGGGIRAMKTNERTGPVATARIVAPDDVLLMITTDGVVHQTPVENTHKLGRSAQGVIMMRLDASDRVVAMARLAANTGESEEPITLEGDSLLVAAPEGGPRRAQSGGRSSGRSIRRSASRRSK